MIEITTNRVGTLTQVTAICPSDAIAEGVRQIFRNATSRYTTEPGLVVTVTCKRSEAERIAAAVERLSYRTAPQAAATSLPDDDATSGRHRELIQATIEGEAIARNRAPMVNGRRLAFTGFGAEFIGREIHGHLWGERVRYAYYASAA